MSVEGLKIRFFIRQNLQSLLFNTLSVCVPSVTLIVHGINVTQTHSPSYLHNANNRGSAGLEQVM